MNFEGFFTSFIFKELKGFGQDNKNESTALRVWE